MAAWGQSYVSENRLAVWRGNRNDARWYEMRDNWIEHRQSPLAALWQCVWCSTGREHFPPCPRIAEPSQTGLNSLWGRKRDLYSYLPVGADPWSEESLLLPPNLLSICGCPPSAKSISVRTDQNDYPQNRHILLTKTMKMSWSKPAQACSTNLQRMGSKFQLSNAKCNSKFTICTCLSELACRLWIVNFHAIALFDLHLKLLEAYPATSSSLP